MAEMALSAGVGLATGAPGTTPDEYGRGDDGNVVDGRDGGGVVTGGRVTTGGWLTGGR
jgi:hypothetical protein